MINKTYHPRGKKIDGYFVRKHPSYGVWAGIKTRCNNSKGASYANYGARGITYDLYWEHFENFVRDMGTRPTPAHSIERIDNDKGYSKANCKWATCFEQSTNRRTFKNNTSGFRGVKRTCGGRYTATVNHQGARYKIGGTFDTAEHAYAARCELLFSLRANLDVSDRLVRPARYDSSTGIRGISRHPDGGYMVRFTHTGKRHYLGYFKDLEGAKEALQKWKP